MLDNLPRPLLAILAALAIMLSTTVAWASSILDDDRALAQASPPTTPAPVDEGQLQQRVRALTDFVDRFESENRWQQESEDYGERGIGLFVSAIGPLIPDEDVEYGERYRLLNERLAGIEDAPGVEGGPHYLSEALVEAAQLLALVQWRHYPQFTKAVTEASQAAQALDLSLPPAQQIEQVRTVLTEAALTLERIANAPPSFTGQGEDGQPMRGPIIEVPARN